MNKRIVYTLVGFALIFFIGALIIFVRSRGESRLKEPAYSGQEQEQTANYEPRKQTVKIFFLTEQPLMQPVSFEMTVPPVREQFFRDFLQLMLAGKEGYSVPAPEGVKVRSLYYIPQRQILVVDFNEELISKMPGGTASELEFIYFIVNNICYNFKDVRAVKLMAGGNEFKVLNGHIDVQHPFLPDFRYFQDE